jgi:hypothetical protein
MTLQVDFTPRASALLAQTAKKWGVDPASVLETLVTEYLPPAETEAKPVLSAKNTAALALLKQRIAAEASDDPEEVRKSNAEAAELLLNLNRNRIESGESPIFS